MDKETKLILWVTAISFVVIGGYKLYKDSQKKKQDLQPTATEPTATSEIFEIPKGPCPEGTIQVARPRSSDEQVFPCTPNYCPVMCQKV